MLKRWGKNKWKALPFLIAAQLLVLPGQESFTLLERFIIWIEVRSPRNQKKVDKLKKEFGAGESETVVLSEEIKAVLLADEWRVIKKRQGDED